MSATGSRPACRRQRMAGPLSAVQRPDRWRMGPTTGARIKRSAPARQGAGSHAESRSSESDRSGLLLCLISVCQSNRRSPPASVGPSAEEQHSRRCSGRADKHSDCRMGRPDWCHHAFGSGVYPEPRVLGMAAHSSSSHRSVGSGAWTICFAWDCSSGFAAPPSLRAPVWILPTIA
jgi:hypothetical protein